MHNASRQAVSRLATQFCMAHGVVTKTSGLKIVLYETKGSLQSFVCGRVILSFSFTDPHHVAMCLHQPLSLLFCCTVVCLASSPFVLPCNLHEYLLECIQAPCVVVGRKWARSACLRCMWGVTEGKWAENCSCFEDWKILPISVPLDNGIFRVRYVVSCWHVFE